MVTDSITPLCAEEVRLIEEGHRYIVGTGITERDKPSFSRVMASAGLTTDYSEVDPTHLQFRAAVGTLAHRWVELWIAGRDIDNSGDTLIHRAAEPHFDAFLKWVKGKELVAHYSEHPAFQPNWGYCTTVDFVGLLDGKPWVIDWKTTYKIGRNVGYQTMAQRMCYTFKMESGEAQPQRAALHLPKRGPAKLVTFTDDDYDMTTVIAAAHCYQAKDKC